MANYYDDLGISPSASAEEIEKAYRFLVQKFHPDRNLGQEAEAQARFVRVQRAFEILSNSSKRAVYDEELHQNHFRSMPDSSPALFEGIKIPLNVGRRISNKGTMVWLGTAAAFVILVLLLVALNQRNRDEGLAKIPVQPPFSTTARSSEQSSSSHEGITSNLASMPTQQGSPDDPSAQAAIMKTRIGPAPSANSDGSLDCVKQFLNENLDDPNGLQFVQWSGIALLKRQTSPPHYIVYRDDDYWGVRVKYRAKNKFGTLELHMDVFLIQNGKVVRVVDSWPTDGNEQLWVEEAFPKGTFPGEGPIRKREPDNSIKNFVNGMLNPSDYPAAEPPNEGQHADEGADLVGSSPAMKPQPLNGLNRDEAAAADLKAPVPNDAAQSKAKELISDLHKVDLANAKLPEEKVAVSQKLLQLAIDTNDDLPAKFILLQMSADLAAEAGRTDKAWMALDKMGQQFDIDIIPKKAAALVSASRLAQNAAEYKTVAEFWQALVRDAVLQDRYELAIGYAVEAERASKSTTDQVFQKLVGEQADQIRQMQTAYAAAKSAKEKLSQSPNDADAGETWGRFLCLYKNDWDRGLPLWSMGNDNGLTTTAKQDLNSPADAEAQVKIADAWENAAVKEQDGLPKKSLQERAEYWYRRAMPGLDGLTKTKVEMRLEEIVNENSPFPRGEWIDVLGIVDLENDTVKEERGAWAREQSEIYFVKSPGKLRIPVAIEGAYEFEIEFSGKYQPKPGSFENPMYFLDISFPANGTVFYLSLPTGKLSSNAPGSKSVQGKSERPISEFAISKRYKLKVKVDSIADMTRVDCELDGRNFVHWEGPVDASTSENNRGSGEDNLITLSVTRSLNLLHPTLHSARLRMISGTASLLDDTHSRPITGQ
jgi:curved DNA-binding protein CbpA